MVYAKGKTLILGSALGMHESDSFVLITTLVTAFGLALIFGYLAERFAKMPALVGYILAGVCVTLVPGLPDVDRAATQEFAELGVMLLMFGVGLHFSIADLMRVKKVAVTGALLQMTCSATAGALLATLAWDWSLPQALVFGLTLSCASTVVVMKALELRHYTSGAHGQVVIGWLVVQDLVSVFIMVCMPLMAQILNSPDALTPEAIAVSLSSTLLGVGVFVAIMLLVGRRLFPFVLRKVAELGSRELFTLCVLALAIGVAYGAGVIFHVSYALGAFFAGMVMRESNYAHRAAVNSLPLQDAFAVLFFVSVGLLLDWHVFIEEPLAVLFVMVIIMLITSTMSMLIVVFLGWPLQTAVIVGACLSQIGEFSFILAGHGISLGLADKETMSLIVAASILTIALNPVMFHFIPKVKFHWVTRYPFMRRAAMRENPLSRPTVAPGAAIAPVLDNHVIVVGFNPMVKGLLTRIKAQKLPVVCLVTPDESLPDPKELAPYGAALISGDPIDPMALIKARVTKAKLLVLPDENVVYNRQILTRARQLVPELKVLVRVPNVDEVSDIHADEDTCVMCDLEATAGAMAKEIDGVFHEVHGPEAPVRTAELDEGPQDMEVKDPGKLQKGVRLLGQQSAKGVAVCGQAIEGSAKWTGRWLRRRFNGEEEKDASHDDQPKGLKGLLSKLPFKKSDD